LFQNQFQIGLKSQTAIYPITDLQAEIKINVAKKPKDCDFTS